MKKLTLALFAMVFTTINSFAAGYVVSGATIQMVQPNWDGTDRIMFQILTPGSTSQDNECGQANRKLYIRKSTVGETKYKELLTTLLTALTMEYKIAVWTSSSISTCDDVYSVSIYPN